MSAFIVSKKHIDTLVNYANIKDVRYYYRGKMYSCSDMDATGQILLNANVKSVNVRYDEHQEPEKYRAGLMGIKIIGDLPAVNIIKACHCLTYQSCELVGWGKSRAKSILDAIEKHAEINIPGYDNAPWDID
jgi:hypothetical protein